MLQHLVPSTSKGGAANAALPIDCSLRSEECQQHLTLFPDQADETSEPRELRSRYASPMITLRTGISSIRVLAFETASDSMSKVRSFSAGDRSFSASRPVVLHASLSMAGSSGVCELADAASMRVTSEYVNTRMIDFYSCLGSEVSISRRCKEPANFEVVPKSLFDGKGSINRPDRGAEEQIRRAMTFYA